MIKLLYLLVGISLKQTVDEFKSLVQTYITYLEERREAMRQYKPNPAIEARSAEAVRAIAAAQHASVVGPQIRKFSRRIIALRFIPLGIYVIVTVVLIWCITLMENAGAGATL